MFGSPRYVSHADDAKQTSNDSERLRCGKRKISAHYNATTLICLEFDSALFVQDFWR